MRVVVCCNPTKSKTIKILPKVFEKLEELGIDYLYNGEITNDTEIVITVGGDGTILTNGKVAAEKKVPLLGINTGRLGFMANLECNELQKLEQLKNGNYRISKRMMLDVTICGKTYIALNDVVFMKTIYSKLPEFKVSSEGIEISRIRADGIILSTPTGSTAYALSAGGPIIEPELECIEFTPLCAHTLFGRPMILNADNGALTVCYDKYEGGSVLVSVDGDEAIPIEEDEKAIIKKSSLQLNLIDIDGNSFYNSVHNKLMRPLK